MTRPGRHHRRDRPVWVVTLTRMRRRATAWTAVLVVVAAVGALAWLGPRAGLAVLVGGVGTLALLVAVRPVELLGHTGSLPLALAAFLSQLALLAAAAVLLARGKVGWLDRPGLAVGVAVAALGWNVTVVVAARRTPQPIYGDGDRHRPDAG